MGVSRIVITIMSGAEDGKVFEFDKTLIILGRHPEDDVCLPYDTRVSRHHARITQENSHYFIEDIGPEGKGSSNGTYLEGNENKITGKTSLQPGTMMLLGVVGIRFEVK